MPALSYKERFCPFVKDYSKMQSIRAFRKRPFKTGDKLMHFFGMRTKHCQRLIPDTVCTEVQTVFIFSSGKVFLLPVMSKNEADRILKAGEKVMSSYYPELDNYQKDLLAFNDGFRVNNDVSFCFDLMLRWWKQTHDLPFCGQLIK